MSEAEVSRGFIKESEIVIRLTQAIVEVVILSTRENAPSSNPHEAILAWLERTLDQTAEPKKLRKCGRKLATKCVLKPCIAIRFAAITEFDLLLLAPGGTFGGCEKAHCGRFGLTRKR